MNKFALLFIKKKRVNRIAADSSILKLSFCLLRISKALSPQLKNAAEMPCNSISFHILSEEQKISLN